MVWYCMVWPDLGPGSMNNSEVNDSVVSLFSHLRD